MWTCRWTRVLILKPVVDMIEIPRSPLLPPGTASVRPWPSLSRLFYPPLACRVCRVWFTRPIWMWSDHRSAWICTWSEEGKKPTLGDILCPASDQVSGIKVEEVRGRTHGWSSPHGFKKKPVELMVRFLHILHFLPSLSLSLSAGIIDLWPHQPA